MNLTFKIEIIYLKVKIICNFDESEKILNSYLQKCTSHDVENHFYVLCAKD